MADILLITDLLDIRSRKLKELEFYTQQLEELNKKLFFLKKEIDLTNSIIEMINKETLLDIGQYIKKEIT
jgi:hypothetical protein